MYFIRETPFSFPSEYTLTFTGNVYFPSRKQITVTFSQCLANSSTQRTKNPRIGSSVSTAWVTINSFIIDFLCGGYIIFEQLASASPPQGGESVKSRLEHVPGGFS